VRRYELQDVVIQQEVEVGRACDGCGVTEDDAESGLIAVTISINEGEEMGGVDELDYCDPCLVERAPAFVIAGSTAEYVTGRPVELDDDGPA
jgi:hypothetical protein